MVRCEDDVAIVVLCTLVIIVVLGMLVVLKLATAVSLEISATLSVAEAVFAMGVVVMSTPLVEVLEGIILDEVVVEVKSDSSR